MESYLRLADWNQLTRMEEGNAKSFNWAASPEMVEWRAKQSTKTIPPEQTRQLLLDLLHEPSEITLLDELETLKHLLNPNTPISWLKETLHQELWEEEIFQGGDVPLPPGLQTVWDRLSSHLGHPRQIPADTIRTWWLSLMGGNTDCSGNCRTWMCGNRICTGM